MAPKNFRIKFISLIAGIFSILPVIAVGNENYKPDCRIVAAQHDGTEDFLEIDKIWSGVRTTIGAAEPAPGHLLVAYYDAERRVTLASADAASGQVCITHFDSLFSGWDGHNLLAMAVAADGTVHVAGNAHAQKLFYAEGKADDIGTVRQGPMTGKDEDRATYPTFYRAAGDRLVFLYRSGGSGDGSWLANGWQSGHWDRIGALFAAADAKGASVSAYPTSFVRDSLGRSHVAIVWRQSPDASSNFAVSYARTEDFRSWSGLQGPSRRAPLRPEDAQTVETTGVGAGLLNTAQLILTSDDTPVIFYMRYGVDGTNALIAAAPDGTKWTTRELAHSRNKTAIEGKGSLPLIPRFNVSRQDDTAVIRASFPGEPSQDLQLDLRTMAVSPAQSAGKPAPASPPTAAGPARATQILQLPAGLSGPALRTQAVTASGYDGPGLSWLSWYTQTVDHDAPLPCTTQTPKACDPPPSPLLWQLPARP